MGTVVIELEGMLSFGEQEGGFCQAAISVGKGDWLDVLIAKRLGLALDRVAAPDGDVGRCKLRLEIERDE